MAATALAPAYHGQQALFGSGHHILAVAFGRSEAVRLIGAKGGQPHILRQQPGNILKVVQIVAVDGHANGQGKNAHLHETKAPQRSIKALRRAAGVMHLGA